MPPPDQTRCEYIRRERRSVLITGPLIAVIGGVVAFCLVVPILALLNVIVPHLPWIPAGRPVEPPIATAWACARLVFFSMLALSAVLFVIVPGKPPRPSGDV